VTSSGVDGELALPGPCKSPVEQMSPVTRRGEPTAISAMELDFGLNTKTGELGIRLPRAHPTTGNLASLLVLSVAREHADW